MCDSLIMHDSHGKILNECINLRCFKFDEKYNPDKKVHKYFIKPFERKKKESHEEKEVFIFYYDVEKYKHNERYNGSDHTIV